MAAEMMTKNIQIETTTIAFPVLFLFFSILSCIWFSFVFRKKNISTRQTIVWLLFNIIFLVFSFYLLIIGLIYIGKKDEFPYEKYNFLDWIGKNVFGIQTKNSWVILLLVLMSFILLVIAINISIKFNELNRKINDLNRNIAVLKGKIAIEFNDLDFSTAELSASEFEDLLEEQLAKEKLKIKYKNRLRRLTYNDDLNPDVNTKTLLNLKEGEHTSRRKKEGNKWVE